MKSHYLFVFVILHYNLSKITEQCIESISNNLDWKDYAIVVVDNNSPDGSGVKLMKKYESIDRVIVLINQSNLGFAKGNNVGIKYAKDVLNADFICCINNDTIMIDNGFVSKTISEYFHSYAAVIGPQIICGNGSIQRIGRYLKSAGEYEKKILILEGKYTLHKSIIKEFLKRNRLIMYLYKKIYNIVNEKRMLNIILHGCCLTFTPKFFEKLDGFNEKTFMYAEEELLYLALKQNNLTSVYNPKIKIKHLEDLSTDSVCNTSKEKNVFIKKNRINSLNILIKEIEEYEKRDSVTNN